MNRLFPVLAAFALAFLAATLVLGLSLGDVRVALRDLHAAEQELAATGDSSSDNTDSVARLEQKIGRLDNIRQWTTVHFLAGIFTSVIVLFVSGIGITYFVGTSRWCREVVDTYKLDVSLARNSNRLKRRTFPVLAVSMLALVVIVALGGAADPGANLQLSPPGGLAWRDLHLASALLGTALVAWAYYLAWRNIIAHQEVMNAIMVEVKRIRGARGLPE